MVPDYDSILMATDPNVINVTEFYQVGIAVPSRTVPMREWGEGIAENDYAVVAMAAVFMVVAAILFVSRSVLIFRFKDFFASKRLFVDTNATSTIRWKVCVFLLTLVGAASLSLMYWRGQAELVDATVPYWLMAACFLVLLCFVYVKSWVYALVNWVFFDSEANRRWMSGYFLLTATSAFPFYFLAMLDVCDVWNRELVTAGVIMVVILYELLLFYKLFINFRVRIDGYLLNILYFCTVELLPTLVLSHVTVWVSENVIVQNLIH